MSKNLISQIAELLGVELGEEFKAVSKDGSERICTLCHDGLLDNTNYAFYNKDLFVDIVCGDAKIIKLPWKPAYRQKYWTFGLKDGIWVVVPREWEDYPAEYLLFKAGWIYRTEKEACAALPGVAKEMDVEFMVKEDSND